jgi:hypothetical protein
MEDQVRRESKNRKKNRDAEANEDHEEPQNWQSDIIPKFLPL